MTIEEIRKNAPDGAKYYSNTYGYFIRSYREWALWSGREFINFYIPVRDIKPF